MSTNIGKAYVQIVPSAEGISGAVSNVLNNELPAAGVRGGGALAKGLGKGLKTGAVAVGASMVAATAAVVGFSKASVETGMDFDASMSQIAATLGWTTSEIQNNVTRNGVLVGDTFQALRDKAQEMGSATIFSASEAADGLNILAMSGFSASESINMIDDVLHLAAAGSMDMASAAGYISGAMKGFNDETKDSGYYADLMAKGATLANTNVQQLGEAMSSGAAGAAAYSQSAESMTVALLRLAEQGEVGSAAGTALAAAMKNLYTPTDKARAVLEELGVNAFDPITHTARDFNTVVNELDAALAGYTEQEQAAYKQTIFGIQGLDAYNKMTVTGVARQNEWAAALSGASDGMGEAAKQYGTMTDNLKGDLAGWSSALDGLKIAVSDSLTPTIREFVQFATSGLSSVTEAFKTGGIEGAVDALAEVLTHGIDMVMEVLPQVVDAGMTLLFALCDGIIQNLPAITDAALRIIESLAMYLIENLPALVEAAIQLLVSLVNFITASLPTLIPAAIEMIKEIVKALIDNLDLLIDAAMQLIIAINLGIIQNLPLIWEAMFELIDALLTALVDCIPQLIESGKDLVRGIWDGILSMGGWLLDMAKQWANSFIDGVKDFFGIASPSKVFANFGEMMMLGLGEGIEDNAGVVSRAMDGINDMIDGEMQSSLDLNSDASIGTYATSDFYMDAEGADQQTALLREQNGLLRELIAKSGVYLDGKKLNNSIGRYARAMGV